MDVPALLPFIGLAHALLYARFVSKRGDAGFPLSLVLAIVLGPLVWFVWLAQRAGARRAARSGS